MPCGPFIAALVAAPPSPVEPTTPLPATVVMTETGTNEGELERVPDAVAVGDAVRVGVTLAARAGAAASSAAAASDSDSADARWRRASGAGAAGRGMATAPSNGMCGSTQGTSPMR